VGLKFAKEKKKPSGQQEKVGDGQHLWAKAPEHTAMPAGEKGAPQPWTPRMLLSPGPMGRSPAVDPHKVFILLGITNFKVS